MLSDFVGAVRFDRAIAVVVVGTFVVGNVAWLLRQRGLRDGFSRKLNHFILSALSGVCLFGLPDESFVPTAVAASVLVLLVYVWSAHSSYEFVSRVIRSNVRDRDGEKGNFFVFLPLLTGQIATYSALALVSPLYAKVAFCAMGLGDGLAEPVGLRFGKRRYSVYDPVWRVQNTKSIEGSSAVFSVSLISCLVALWFGGSAHGWELILVSLAFSALMTVVEALSPRGLDNMLIVGCGAAFLHFFLG